MWHLRFAAANLPLSVATAVAFSSKLSREWVKLKKSRAGALADMETWVQVPLCNQRKPLISMNPWEKGGYFCVDRSSLWGDVCLPGGWMHSQDAPCGPVCSNCVFFNSTLLPLLFCPPWAAHLLSVIFPSEWKRIFVKKKEENRSPFLLLIEYGRG